MEIVHIAIFCLSLLLMYRSNKWLSLPSFSQLFATLYILFILSGTFYFYNEEPELYEKAFLITNTGLLAFSFGCFFCSAFNFLNSRDFDNYKNKPFVDSFHNIPLSISVTILVLISCVLVALYFRNGIPIMMEDVDSARLQASRGGGYFFMGITRFLPLLTLIIMARLYLRKSVFLKIFFYIVLTLTVLVNILSGYRAPLLNFLIIILLFHFYIKGAFTWKFIFGSVVIFPIIFFGISYWKLKGNEDILNLLAMVFMDRVILENPQNIFYITQIFPSREDFLTGGSYIMDFTSALPGPGISFGGWLFSQTPSSELFGLAQLTPTLVGEFYANFSLTVTCMLMFIFGYFLTWFFIRFLRSDKNPIYIAFFISIAFSLVNSVSLGLGTLIYTRLLVYIGVFAMVLSIHKLFDLSGGKRLKASSY